MARARCLIGTVTRVNRLTQSVLGIYLLMLLALGATPHVTQTVTTRASLGNRFTIETDQPPSARRALAVTSEGLVVVGAPTWHAAGHNGSGTRVAIVDMGFDGWDTLPDGELPSDVQTAAFDNDGVLDTGTDHGTQMAEIIHDVAPEAELVFVTFSDAYMTEMVDWLIATKVDVVSMSLEWTEGPLDGTHFSAPEIERAIDAGITWVVAAGNSAKRHHVGTTVDDNENSWVELNGTSTEFNEFRLSDNASADLLLTWNDRATDLDICVFDMEELSDGSPTQIMCTAGPQGNGEPAIETMTLENTTGASRLYAYSIKFFTGVEVIYDTRIWGSSNLQFSNPAASIGVPANMTDVLTVGAIAWDTEVLQPYSGWGPNQQGILKPEVVAPDQITTSQWAGVSNTGTSYAAPHVAGIVSLMLGAMPDLTPDQVKNRLKTRASQTDSPDHRQGWGIVRLGALPSSIVGIRGHWAESSIDWAFTTGITAACPATEGAIGSTCPELPVTRDEMAQFMWRSKGQPTPATTATFGDVETGAHYGTAVDWLAEEAITLGCTTTNFCPDSTVTRAEMAAFLWRLEGSPEGSTPAGFSDVLEGAFYDNAADWLLATGITTGCKVSFFCPQGTVTRAEIFTFLHRLEDLD